MARRARLHLLLDGELGRIQNALIHRIYGHIGRFSGKGEQMRLPQPVAVLASDASVWMRAVIARLAMARETLLFKLWTQHAAESGFIRGRLLERKAWGQCQSILRSVVQVTRLN